MGRYISGDIDGKCWFGLQNSDFMDRFGVSYSEYAYINYYYGEDDLPALQEELKAIEDSLGDTMQRIDDFFEQRNSYNDAMLTEANITKDQLSDYADYKFAKKVEAYIIEHGECSFEVEC